MRIRTTMLLAILLMLTTVNAAILRAQSGTSSATHRKHQRCDRGSCSQCHCESYGGKHGSGTNCAKQRRRAFSLRSGQSGDLSDFRGGRRFRTGRVATFNGFRGADHRGELHFEACATSQTVEVTAQTGLLSLDNPNTSTTLEAKAIEKLPNPGQDLTYIAQFAQGALMNTAGSSNDAKAAGGYGNVEFNGLPATSNGYILDGYDTNDPWLGLNIGLSTNLVIGLDAVQEATVNTNSFSVDQGRYAVAQVNYFTKSGTNVFHGDAYEIWNGSLFNAEDYFLHANDTADSSAKKPRSTVNEFGVSIGGPIRRDRLFFFGHYEGIRIALPIVSQITLPTPAYQQYVLGQLATGGTDPVRAPLFRLSPRRSPFTRRCSLCYPHPAAPRSRLSGARLGTNGRWLCQPAPGFTEQ